MAAHEAESVYEPLDSGSQELRLVILKPGRNPQDVIECTLIKESLANDIKFEALSYEWGTDCDNRKIIIDGREVSVRRNLWDALRHLRSREERTLWIDAICS